MILRRVSRNQHGIFGVLIDDSESFALTVELPWRENKPNISCIPEGIYTCKRVRSPRFGDTFEIADVSGRTHILFHIANTVDDLLGCVGVGEEFGRLKDKTAVLSSRRGFGEFMRRLEGKDTFPLAIKRCYGDMKET